MNRATALCVCVLALQGILMSSARAAALTTVDWKVDGVTRKALVHFPTITNGAPLIFAFHGHGGTMNVASSKFRLHEVWPEAVVVYPQGLLTKTPRDLQGTRPGWLMLPAADNQDLKLFDAMLETATAIWHVDTNRVYVTGHSNGGGFSYLLWGTRGEALAAVAPVAAFGAQFLRGAKPCPLLHIAGRTDAIVDFNNQEAAVAAARKLNGTNAPVEFVVYEGGHIYPDDAPEKTVAFFKQQARKKQR
jgi:polyhydroxybutyrate depolymerase